MVLKQEVLKGKPKGLRTRNKMLEIKTQRKIVERIVRTKTGQLVRAVFLVAECDGELRVRLLSAVPVSDSKATSYQLPATSFSLCLKGKCVKSSAVTAERHIFTETVSPFFNKFEFFVSQPTRAPSFK